MEYQRANMAYERQLKYMEGRLETALAALDP